MPSTVPRTDKRICVMPLPGWKSTSADVSNVVGGCPCLPSPLDNAIEKQEECAAAINSSGLVLPLGSSERAAHDTSYVPTPDDCNDTLPLPSARPPFHVVAALRVVAMPPVLPLGRAHETAPDASPSSGAESVV